MAQVDGVVMIGDPFRKDREVVSGQQANRKDREIVVVVVLLASTAAAIQKQRKHVARCVVLRDDVVAKEHHQGIPEEKHKHQQKTQVAPVHFRSRRLGVLWKNCNDPSFGRYY